MFVKSLNLKTFPIKIRNKGTIFFISRPTKPPLLPQHAARIINIYIPPTVFPYCATSIDMLVPRGQLRDISSMSHPAFWYVLKVPDRSAVRRYKFEM